MGFVYHNPNMVLDSLNLTLGSDHDATILHATQSKGHRVGLLMKRLVMDKVLMNRMLNPRDIVTRISYTIVTAETVFHIFWNPLIHFLCYINPASRTYEGTHTSIRT